MATREREERSSERGTFLRAEPKGKLGTPENPRSLLPEEAVRGPLLWWRMPTVRPDRGSDSDGLQLASVAWAHLDSLRTQQEQLVWLQALNATIYHGGAIESFVSLYGGMTPVAMWGQGMLMGGPIHNIVRSCVDTVVATMSMSKPKATAVSMRGTWEDRLKCEGLTDFGAGLAEQTDIYSMLPRLDTDAAIFGDGFLKVSVRDGKFCAERRLSPNLLIDEREGYMGDPRFLFERGAETRERLAVLYPDAADVIEQTMTTADADYFRPPIDDAYSTVIEYVEGWRLPANPGSEGRDGNGRHIVFTRAGVLCDEPWQRAGFPFVKHSWSQPTLGWRGESFVSSLRNGQLKTNRIDTIIDETMRRMSVGRWLVPSGSNLVVEHLNNEIGAVVRHDGPPPTKDNSDAVPSELPSEREFEMMQQPALAGVSPLAASGQVPSGLRSGEALKVHSDLQTRRFAPLEQRRGRFIVDFTRCGFELVRDYVRNGKEYKVWTLDRWNQSRIIDYGTVDLDSEAFKIRISATNFMADSPEDRTDQAISFAQAGIFDQVEMVDAIDFPDIQSITAAKTAGLRFVKWICYKLARDSEFMMAPEATFDLVHGIPYVRAARQQLIMDGAPAKLLLKFLVWERAAMALVPPPLGTKQPPMPAQIQVGAGEAPGPPGPMPPMGQPAAPPVSQMMPFNRAG